jgi:hypothetical protein
MKLIEHDIRRIDMNLSMNYSYIRRKVVIEVWRKGASSITYRLGNLTTSAMAVIFVRDQIYNIRHGLE